MSPRKVKTKKPSASPQSTKPEWFSKHEQSDLDAFRTLNDKLDELKAMFEPVLDTYKTVGKLGKWGKVVLGTAVTIATLVLALRQLGGH